MPFTPTDAATLTNFLELLQDRVFPSRVGGNEHFCPAAVPPFSAGVQAILLVIGLEDASIGSAPNRSTQLQVAAKLRARLLDQVVRAITEVASGSVYPRD